MADTTVPARLDTLDRTVSKVVVSDPAHHVVWKTVPDVNCSMYEGSAGGVSSRDRHNIDECATNPCKHHGRCENKDGGYTCICSAGWTGQNCQQDIDECATNPCQQGRCENQDGGYTCTCSSGWTRKNRQQGCPDGYVYHQPSHLCFKAFNYRATYNSAVRRCSVDGGTLAMPRDTATNNFLIDLKNTVDKNAEFRFGLTDRHQEGVWMWDDNVPLGDFRAWGPKQPDNWYKAKGEDCAEYLYESWSSSRKNKWNDGRCTFADRKFICQVSPSGQPGEGKLKVQGSGLKAMAGGLGTYYTNFKKGEGKE
ncbi:PREDICTED: neurocan core protein-like [Branchiostoma belcheri]|uniref:Neurocan core protein-like n=1 Tax=Branchiostoma belcheri TaxID=7741 RepID=A0A6P4Y033_BRABE|nr:PREDICTED: neurocan core protein-like [Branchiostoma belcheri]